MAEMEHARWNMERIRDGWTLGEKDSALKRSLYLVPRKELSEDIKQLDRDSVYNIGF